MSEKDYSAEYLLENINIPGCEKGFFYEKIVIFLQDWKANRQIGATNAELTEGRVRSRSRQEYRHKLDFGPPVSVGGTEPKMTYSALTVSE